MTEEEMGFSMPEVSVGYTVKVYPYGYDDGKPHFGFVARANDRSIDVHFPLGNARGGVPHVDDPRLRRSEEYRKEYGAWDFTDETKAMRTFLKDREAVQTLEKRVKSLEELLDRKTK